MARTDERHPVLTGLAALVSVAVVVGLIVGVIAITASHVLGVGNDGSSGGVAVGASLYLPTPSPTRSATGALLTLSAAPSTSAGGPGSTGSTGSTGRHHDSSSSPSDSAGVDKGINLTASTVTASPMEQFTLSGTYPAGEGHILRVQRMTPGSSWQDFGIPDMDVQGGQFATPIETGRTGKNSFRVSDVDTGKVSNVVTVTVGG